MSNIKNLPRRSRKGVVGTFTFLLCSALLLSFSPGQIVRTNAAQAGGDSAAPQRLTPGQTVERELKGGESHIYLISLRQGEFLRVLAEQKDVNVIVTLRTRAGAKLVEVDLQDEGGPEPISYEAVADGEYLLEVSAKHAKAQLGRYSVVSSAKPRATAEDRTRMVAERLRLEAEELYRAGGAVNRRRALAKARQSLPLWRGLGDRYWAGHTLNSVGVIYDDLGERQKALDFYQEALSLRRSIGDRAGEALTLANLGAYHRNWGQEQQAIDFFKQAAAAYRAAGDRFGEAVRLNDVGVTYAELGKNGNALEFYQEAAAIFKDMGERLAEADVLNNIGGAYRRLKDREKALTYFNESLALYRANGGQDNQANTLIGLGDLYLDAEDRQKALDYYEQAAAHARAIGAQEWEAKALWNVGKVQHQLGDTQKALDHYNRGLELLQQARISAWQHRFLSSIGDVYDGLGERQKAVEYYERALKLYTGSGDGPGEADTLMKIGNAYYRRDKKKALNYYFRAARLRRAAGDRKAEAETLKDIGVLYGDLRQWQSGLAYSHKALKIYKAIGDRNGEAQVYVNIGVALYHQNKLSEAREYYERAIPLFRETDAPGGEATALNNIGIIYDVTGDKPKALEYYGRALPLYRKRGIKDGEADVLIDMGLIYAHLGEQRKALDYYGQSLALRRELHDAGGEADTLTNIGVSQRELGEDRKAVEAFERALTLRRTAEDKYGEVNALKKVADTYYALGEHRKALERYRQSLPLLKELKDREGETEALALAGALELILGEYQQAITHFRQAQANARADRDRELEAALLTFIGGAHAALNQDETALAEFRQALRVFDAGGNTLGKAWALFLMGATYEELKEYGRALEYYNLSLGYMKSLGVPRLEGELLKNVGDIYVATGKRPEALDAYARALEFQRAARNASGEQSVLVAIGDVFEGQGEKEKAAAYYARAISLKLAEPEEAASGAAPPETKAGTYDSLGERKEPQTLPGASKERLAQLKIYLGHFQMDQAAGLAGPAAESLSRAMGTIKSQTPDFAIILGKQAVAKYQEVLADPNLYNKELGDDTYMRSFASACRDLADILIERGRLYEAQQVLAMLKEGEYVGGVRRDGSEIAALSQRVDLRPGERELFAEYTRIFDQITAVGSRRTILHAKDKDKDKLGIRLSDAERAELEQLNKELSKANEAFDAFFVHIKAEFDQAGRDIIKEIRENRGLQSDLSKWGEGVVTLHTFVGPNRYRVILTTPEAQVDGKYEITAAELNRKIMAFRQALMNPAVDPRPQARELYDIVLKPVEKALEGANAKTLVWSLDGALRYLPLPALYDGRQYVVERYRQAIITLASLPRLSDQVRGEWRGLGLGVSAQWDNFSALPAVVGELGAIIRDQGPPCVSDAAKDSVVGVMPGRCLVDKDFTARSFADALGRDYSLIHIASHFSLSPGGADKSFLLLGDGSRLTLKTFDNAAEYALTNVELLTLSACNTGMDGGGAGPEANGAEVENFGVIAQKRGAKAVIATLWAVGDDSTRALMREFYRIYRDTPNVTKAGALRRAQLTLLNGDPTAAPPKAHAPRAEPAVIGNSNPNGPPFPKSPGKPYAHPYYWAPFILIGNWR